MRLGGLTIQNLAELRAGTAEKAGHHLDCALTNRSVDSQVCTDRLRLRWKRNNDIICRAATPTLCSPCIYTNTAWPRTPVPTSCWAAGHDFTSSTSGGARGRKPWAAASPRLASATSSSASSTGRDTCPSRRAE